jgi:hypothetical protein
MIAVFRPSRIGVFSATRCSTPLDGGIMLFAMLGSPCEFLAWYYVNSLVGLAALAPISGQVPVLDPLQGDWQQAVA